MDWARAFRSLLDAGFIEGRNSIVLTASGLPAAARCAVERPDVWWYWYRDFYARAPGSPTHARFCEQVYGCDLCQHGMADMHELAKLLDVLELTPANHVLELGCGAGFIARHIRRKSGARVTGIDYATTAIEEARRRFGADERLTFMVADMNALELAPQRFNTAISIDTLYFVDNITQTLERMISSLVPGAQVGIFFSQWLEEGEDLGRLEPDHTDLAESLKALNLRYEFWSFTEHTKNHLRVHRQTLAAMRNDFELEDMRFLYDFRLQDINWILPFVDGARISRHLYRAHMD